MRWEVQTWLGNGSKDRLRRHTQLQRRWQGQHHVTKYFISKKMALHARYTCFIIDFFVGPSKQHRLPTITDQILSRVFLGHIPDIPKSEYKKIFDSFILAIWIFFVTGQQFSFFRKQRIQLYVPKTRPKFYGNCYLSCTSVNFPLFLNWNAVCTNLVPE